MAEFALIFPILAITIFAIIDFGWMVFNFSQLYNGLREGVRFGSVRGYAVTAQYTDCDGIRKRIVDLSGFSGVKATDIKVWYDDGRALAAAYDDSAQEVGTCKVTSSYVPNPAYTKKGKVTAESRPPTNGDRVVIDIDVNVQFLTPFFRPLAPNGINMHLRAARSIFPDGLES